MFVYVHKYICIYHIFYTYTYAYTHTHTYIYEERMLDTQRDIKKQHNREI